jgi:hypothetical protein
MQSEAEQREGRAQAAAAAAARSVSVFRLHPALHFLLGVRTVAVPVQGNTVVHAAAAAGRRLEEPATPLIHYQRTGTAFGHESEDAAVGAAAGGVRCIRAIDKRAFGAMLISVHGANGI